ncbi:MAG TPA: M20 family metallopeptidase [Trueperaceae bacterium]|nr:M20 family metallopeptidase [Trueperaceae bacterium]
MSAYPSELARRAAEAVDPELVARLAHDLVRIRSVYDAELGTTEAAAASYVANHFRSVGLVPVVEEAAPGRPNVVCDWQGTGFDPARHRTLMFEGHTDVVTEGDPAKWAVPPFEGVVDGDVLHGRGSADMKAGVAASLAALEAVRAVAPDLTGRIRFGIVADEEGMMLGIKHFIRQGWADDVSGAIIAEPEENELCLFQKGAMRVNVRVVGVMSHGAMPYAGVNPNLGLADLIVALRDFERREQERLGPHEFLGLPWITPTVIRSPATGEAQLNVMPEEAYAVLDIRTVPGQDHAEIEAELRRIAADIERATDRLHVHLDVFESRPWTQTRADDPLVGALEAVYEGVFGTPPRYGGVPGATDGTFLWAWKDVPIVTVGPGDRTIPHQVNEFVRLSEVVASARLYAAAAVTYLSSDR